MAYTILIADDEAEIRQLLHGWEKEDKAPANAG